jgi:predicted secreted Zn-dependent protease
MTIKEILQLRALLPKANEIAQDNPELEKIWDQIQNAIRELEEYEDKYLNRGPK